MLDRKHLRAVAGAGPRGATALEICGGFVSVDDAQSLAGLLDGGLVELVRRGDSDEFVYVITAAGRSALDSGPRTDRGGQE